MKTKVPQVKASFPFIAFADRAPPTRLARRSNEFDARAFTLLSYAAYPLMAAYTVYSLLREQHKSWYSFVLGTTVGYVYVFGFLNLFPQLYLNYRLKSVAHMPWKSLMYKTLNTFIGGSFAIVRRCVLLTAVIQHHHKVTPQQTTPPNRRPLCIHHSHAAAPPAGVPAG